MELKAVLFSIVLTIMSVIRYSDALFLTKTLQTYARFPRWDACTNSSFSFEFKTSFPKALLMYVDDNGKFDYVELMVFDGSVRLRMNIVDGREGSIEITLGSRVNDNKWHRVEIQRNRMETTLYMDSFHQSRVAFGSDFYFGNVSTNSYVYFGGLPDTYSKSLSSLSLSSAYYEPRFGGEIRNVIYGNCTCRPTRAVMIEGKSVSAVPAEACEAKDDCGKCLCISGDDGPACQCLGFRCPEDTNTYYHLPMDVIEEDQVLNPSGLDAKIYDRPYLVSGVMYTALKLDSSRQKLKVSGPGHRNECFGDLSLCPQGYTLGMWIKFDNVGTDKGVYLSNGGHSNNSHGVAMLYQTGSMEWVFRMKTGREWRATASSIFPRRWYHVMVTWNQRNGIAIYINGNKAAQGNIPSENVVSYLTSTYNDFVIGQSNDGTGTRDLGVIIVDDFQFWSSRLDESVLREKGPIYKYHLTMDQVQDGQLITQSLEPRTRGMLQQVPGKIGTAIQILGRGQYIDFGSFKDTCLGNTSLCLYGFTITFWIKFDRLEDNTYFIASSVSGFSVFSYGGRLYANVQYGDRQYQASASGIQTGSWYFIEVTWNPTSGLSLYLNQKLMATQGNSNHFQVPSTNYDNFYIGKANSFMFTEKYAAASFDDMHIYNGDLERLITIGFIQREKPKKHYYNFDKTVGTRIEHPTTAIETKGFPKLVQGKIGHALLLSGNSQDASFDHGDGCLGNLDYCPHGVLLALWLRPEQPKEGMVYLSSGVNGLELSYTDRLFKVSATNSVNQWKVTTTKMAANTWYYLEITWSEETGLHLYLNNDLVEKDTNPSVRIDQSSTSATESDRFIIGYGNTGGKRSVYGAATYDEMEFWEASRDYLVAFGYIQRGKPENFYISMDKADNNGTIIVSDIPIKLVGSPLLVPGKFGKSLKLNGRSQYADFGERGQTCLTNLGHCTFGISIFMWVKLNYDNNMYMLSTGSDGIKMYYSLGYIYITVDHDRKSWRISVPKISEDEWHFLELSWHPDFGLSFFVDNKLQDYVTFRSIPQTQVSGSEHFYIGAPNSDDVTGQRFSYGNMALDDMEIWYGRREELLAFDYIVRGISGLLLILFRGPYGRFIHHPISFNVPVAFSSMKVHY